MNSRARSLKGFGKYPVFSCVWVDGADMRAYSPQRLVEAGPSVKHSAGLG